MKTFKLILTRDIIRGYTTETFEVEADSLEEAKEILSNNNGEIESVDDDLFIRDTEFLSIEEE